MGHGVTGLGQVSEPIYQSSFHPSKPIFQRPAPGCSISILQNSSTLHNRPALYPRTPPTAFNTHAAPTPDIPVASSTPNVSAAYFRLLLNTTPARAFRALPGKTSLQAILHLQHPAFVPGLLCPTIPYIGLQCRPCKSGQTIGSRFRPLRTPLSKPRRWLW